MSLLYETYKKLNLDTSPIGLAKEDDFPYFCTPVGANIIGWDNGIHYCFIKGFDEMVFTVNPDTCCDYHVYPLANSFADFIGLVLAASGTNSLQQIILWDQPQYLAFINDPNEIEYAKSPKVSGVLAALQEGLGVTPMADPFAYVKEIQQSFDYHNIAFRDEFYEITGQAPPK